MVTSEQYSILRRLVAYGKPVQKTLSGFELDRGRYLCRMNDMSGLRSLGLVEKVGDQGGTIYGLTDAGRQVAARRDIWEMTREEYFNDQVRVRDDVSVDARGFRISYEYTEPHPAGPFKGVAIVDTTAYRAGDAYSAPYGRARVTSVSREKVASKQMDLGDVFEAAKALHKREVFEAAREGKPVREEVLAEYPDLAPLLVTDDMNEESGGYRP